MGYRNLQRCVDDLERGGHLVRLEDEVDAHLEAAEIHRRVYANQGPAILFNRVKDCRFPLVSNLFGSLERARYMFRDRWETVRRVMALKVDPAAGLQRPWQYWNVPWAALSMLPKRTRRGPVLAHQTSLGELPQLQSWPRDGGAYVTLPLVYTESPEKPGWQQSNLGMYRVQISGGSFQPDREVGLHYQIHRGIGVHHAAALRRGEPLRVNILVGGTPAMTLSAVMPLPEGLSELTFAGLLAGHRMPLAGPRGSLPIYGEADFCIQGVIRGDRQLPEGPFGDHLGYYSLVHDFPVLEVERVWHRPGAIWPFTVVGRPPQEDTTFGQLIHELTGPVVPTLIAGLKAVHAVDAAGVHPLMLAIGSERYVPYRELGQPQELLTQANAILGQGQMSLAKYLLIVAHQDNPALKIHDERAFFEHLLERIDFSRDLHFQTRTTVDTLDYAGDGFNQGSKLVMAAVGPPRRTLTGELDSGWQLPEGFGDPRVIFPGALAVTGPPAAADLQPGRADPALAAFCRQLEPSHPINRFPLIVLGDDSEFIAQSLQNFLWVTFTRSNPAVDLDGIGGFTENKHWGCRGSLVIDARIKPYHAWPLQCDPEIARRVDARASRGGPLARYL